MTRNHLSLLTAAALGLIGTAQMAPAGDDGVIVRGDFADDCCHKVCRPVVATKTISTRVYDDVCEDFCLCKPSFFSSLSGHKACCSDDRDCGCASCGKPRTRKYLVVRNRHHEECQNKCVVEYCPGARACEHGIRALLPGLK